MKQLISFSFGENWLRYLRHIGPSRYESAKSSMAKLLGLDSLKGSSFLDIGCGSGIFSLAAIELGASEVMSFDIDEKSVKACQRVRETCKVENWKITKGSALDKEFMTGLGVFDIVYAWGVLHHTGSMWKAIDNTTSLIKPGGLLAIAIYNRTKTSTFWLDFKRLYNKSSKLLKFLLIFYIIVPRILVRLIKLKHPFKESRGMSIYYDAIDWAGGMPYEFASFDEVCSYLKEKGFAFRNGTRTNSIGCNEFVFQKNLL